MTLNGEVSQKHTRTFAVEFNEKFLAVLQVVFFMPFKDNISISMVINVS